MKRERMWRLKNKKHKKRKMFFFFFQNKKTVLFCIFFTKARVAKKTLNVFFLFTWAPRGT